MIAVAIMMSSENKVPVRPSRPRTRRPIKKSAHPVHHHDMRRVAWFSAGARRSGGPRWKRDMAVLRWLRLPAGNASSFDPSAMIAHLPLGCGTMDSRLGGVRGQGGFRSLSSRRTCSLQVERCTSTRLVSCIIQRRSNNAIAAGASTSQIRAPQRREANDKRLVSVNRNPDRMLRVRVD